MDAARALAVLLAGVIALVLGYATNAYSAPGDLDPFFGTNGKATTDLGQKAEIQAIAVQPDGKIVTAGHSLNTATNHVDSYLARYKPDGTLDTSFGSGGKVVANFSSSTGGSYANDLALQDDGKIVVAGQYITDFALARYNPDGSRDDGSSQDSTPGDKFGTNGMAITSFTPTFDVAYAVAVQPTDGKIVVTGYTATSSDSFGNRYADFAVARYNTDGTLDTTFDGDGWVATNASANNTGHDSAYDVAIQSDGKIVAGGDSQGTGTELTLLRHNTNGSLDDGSPNDSTPGDAFGNSGKATFSFASASALVIQADDKILAAGRYNGDFLLARYTAGGTLDSTFGASGTVSTGFDDPGSGSFDTLDTAQGIALQSDGKIVVAGESEDNSTGARDFALARYDANGDPDANFGDDRDGDGTPDGKLTTPFTGSSDDAAYDLTIQPDGKPVAAGTAGGDFALARYYAGDDTTPPTATTPLHRLVPNSALDATSKVPVRLSWSGNDTDSGLAGYQLQQKTGTGSYTNVPPFPMTVSTKTLSLSPNETYQFRVRALDNNGNWSTWRTGPRFTVDLRQENGVGVSYPSGTWKSQSMSSASGGAIKYATAKGATARFTFQGRSVAWVAPKNPSRGKAEVWLDGVKRATVDLRSPTTQPRRLVFVKEGLNPSVTHNLEVKVLGTAGRPRVDVDAFVVLP
jgi:uncharacterized delta-60 repeat protein